MPTAKSYFSADIRFFQAGTHTVKTIDYGGWEWGHDTFEFDFVSLEEIWLINWYLFNQLADGIINPRDDRKALRT